MDLIWKAIMEPTSIRVQIQVECSSKSSRITIKRIRKGVKLTLTIETKLF